MLTSAAAVVPSHSVTPRATPAAAMALKHALVTPGLYLSQLLAQLLPPQHAALAAAWIFALAASQLPSFAITLAISFARKLFDLHSCIRAGWGRPF